MSEEQDPQSVEADETQAAPESPQAAGDETDVAVEDAAESSEPSDGSEASEATEATEASGPSNPDETSGGLPEASPVEFPEVAGAAAAANLPLERIYDLQVPVSVELGRSDLSVQDLLQLGPGSVIELDQGADAPVSMYVHGKCVAKGEIVVVDEYYGVRITSVG